MNNDFQQLISSIRVVNLFGLYTYRLPEKGSFTNASILYGDNGVGKSTILRLAFHLLSAAGNRGHRNALYKTIFDHFEVELSSGICVSASRDKEFDHLSFRITKSGKKIAVWDFKPKHLATDRNFNIEYETVKWIDITNQIYSKKSKRKDNNDILSGDKAFLKTLENYMPSVFILNAERRLDSDSVSDPSDEVEFRRIMHMGEPQGVADVVQRSREIALTQSISAASKWIAKKAVHAANQGSENVHGVYLNVLHHIQAQQNSKFQQFNDINLLIEKLVDIETISNEFSQYEIETPLNTKKFIEALNHESQIESNILHKILIPYIESTGSRLKALFPIYQIVDIFVKIVNDFLNDKRLVYTLSHGFSVKNKLNIELEPAQLSSGEQQLLLLFFYVLTCRDQQSVFMIDEPEISLNVKWQRLLIQSLLEITQDANIQFIFASHSIELLSQHHHRVVTLTNQK